MKDAKNEILVVDDISKNIQLVASVLKPLGYALRFALSAKEALQIVQDTHIDLILLDVMMPEMNGYELCTLLKKEKKTKDIPIIFLTAKSDAESIAKGFEVGGVDYMSKPFFEVELIARVKTHLEIQTLTNKLKKQAKEMKHLANTDALTGVANRLKFNDILEHQIEISRRHEHNISIIFLDIDYFKKVNDVHGHEVGDSVLIELASIVKKEIRKSDLLARWGGEEFIIVVNNSAFDEAVSLAEKLRICIEKHIFEYVQRITCSFGVTSFHKEDDIHSILLRADKALYQAKEAGRNQVVSLM